ARGSLRTPPDHAHRPAFHAYRPAPTLAGLPGLDLPGQPDRDRTLRTVHRVRQLRTDRRCLHPRARPPAWTASGIHQRRSRHGIPPRRAPRTLAGVAWLLAVRGRVAPSADSVDPAPA